MTDARLGGLGREALVSSTGELRVGGVAREALVSGIGLAARAGARSNGRGTPSVLFSGITLRGSLKAQSSTRLARPTLRVDAAGRAVARAKLRLSLPAGPVVLAGKVTAKSSARIIAVRCAVWDAGATLWDGGASDWDCPVVMGGRIGTAGHARATFSAAPARARQYAVNVS